MKANIYRTVVGAMHGAKCWSVRREIVHHFSVLTSHILSRHRMPGVMRLEHPKVMSSGRSSAAQIADKIHEAFKGGTAKFFVGKKTASARKEFSMCL